MKIVILCGGFGKRLWPLSTPSKPKQFLKLFNNYSLFQKTILRNLSISLDFIIIVNQEQLSLCKEQAHEIKANYTFIVEPASKNTAPAITLAALACMDEILLVVPSDHMISNDNEYIKSIKAANETSKESKLVTFGIIPTSANINYGYIEFVEKQVLSFKEKPNQKLATEYFLSNKYLWNSGMFLFHSKLFIKEMSTHRLNILNKITDIYNKRHVNENTITLSEDLMNNLESISIDYALFEKSKNIAVIPSNFKWSDMGTFKSLYKELYNDEFDLFGFYKKTAPKSCK